MLGGVTMNHWIPQWQWSVQSLFMYVVCMMYDDKKKLIEKPSVMFDHILRVRMCCDEKC